MAFDSRILSGISVFLAVADGGSYRRASAIVGLSTSGVSRAVSRLEERLGLRLFDRTTRSLKLTEAGRLLYDQVMPLLSQIEGVVAAYSGGTSELRGRLRVSTNAAFGHFLLAPRLHAFRARYPMLGVDLLVRDQVGELVAEGYDLAVRFGEPADPSAKKELLMRSRVVTCAAPAYLDRRGRPTHPDDLADHDTICLLNNATGRPHSWDFRKGSDQRRLDLRSGIVVNDAGSILATTLAGAGIARLLDFMVQDHLASGLIEEVMSGWNQSYWPAYAYRSRHAHASPSAAAFIRFIKEQVGNVDAGLAALPFRTQTP